MAETSIEWVKNPDGTQGRTWNPLRGCTRVSPGCGGPGPHGGCYAEGIAARFSGPGQPFEGIAEMRGGKGRWTGKLAFVEAKLTEPLRVRKPTTWFVNSMSDLFHEAVPDEWIDRVFAIMALCPQHTFQVLTKRSTRMRAYCSDPGTPHRLAKAMDALTTAAQPSVRERIVPVEGFPGYFVSDQGRVLSERSSAQCLHCGQAVGKTARARYCSKRCRYNAQYRLRTGRPTLFQPTLAEMSPDVGEDGHCRVILYRDGVAVREFVHRLILTAFERPPYEREQGRHLDGDPSKNALSNLAWGDQPANWDDRRRHGAFRSYAKLNAEQASEIKRRHEGGETAAALGREFGISDTQVRNIRTGRQWAVAPPIQWPLQNCWLGVSTEDQRRADERIPDLLATPAAVRFVSAEPLLSAIDFTRIACPNGCHPPDYCNRCYPDGRAPTGTFDALATGDLHQIIVGGESGPNARPMHSAWARSIRDECTAAGIAFLFKQHGAWIGVPDLRRLPGGEGPGFGVFDHCRYDMEADAVLVGKHRAGRLLDGVEHNGMPEVRHGS